MVLHHKATTLNDKIGHHTVHDHVAVGPVLHVTDEVLHRHRLLRIEQLDIKITYRSSKLDQRVSLGRKQCQKKNA